MYSRSSLPLLQVTHDFTAQDGVDIFHILFQGN